MSETDAAEPTDPYLRLDQIMPRLTQEQVEHARAFGVEEDLPKGTVLFERGDRSVDLFVVLTGEIDIYEQTPDGEGRITTLGPSQFTGETDLLNAREVLVGARALVDTRVIRIPRIRVRAFLASNPRIGEIVMRASILRRVGFMKHDQAGPLLVGPPADGRTLRIERFLARNGYPFRLLDAASEEGAARLHAHDLAPDDTPVVVVPGRGVLRKPTNTQLAAALGLLEPLEPDAVFDLAIVGGGPAGLAAAVYGASEGLETIVLESEAPGGQAGTSSKIENYLGFPTGISGEALAGRAFVQAQKFGAHFAVARCVVRLDCDVQPFALELDDGLRVRARAVVVASGARYRKLDLENFDQFEGNGLHYAATAFEERVCTGLEVIVVGGGNSAGQAAVFLSRRAAHVHVLVRGAGLAESMSNYLIDRIEGSSRITLHTFTEITALHGTQRLEGVTWTNVRTRESETRPICNVFLMLGAVPNTDWLRGCVDLDDKGFVRCGAGFASPTVDRLPNALETSIPGVFAVGDVRAGSVKRVASGVGEGSIVVSAVHRVLGPG
ncbi:MAG: FAD-dependent oxidoreductase [bacterium]|nr:FAD-dependent oxidoreductase [bacterium]